MTVEMLVHQIWVATKCFHLRQEVHHITASEDLTQYSQWRISQFLQGITSRYTMIYHRYTIDKLCILGRDSGRFTVQISCLDKRGRIPYNHSISCSQNDAFFLVPFKKKKHLFFFKLLLQAFTYIPLKTKQEHCNSVRLLQHQERTTVRERKEGATAEG